MTTTSSRLDWPLFFALGGIWGSSYLFIKIGVDAGLPPFTLVMVRLLIGFALLASVVLVARERLPREPRTHGHLMVVGVLNMALPFSLITRAEQSVDSALAATVSAAIPLVVLPIAAVMLRTERVTVNKVIGVLVGFVGVAVLAGFDPSTFAGRDSGPQLALVAATVSYALGAVYARRYVRGLRPMMAAALQVGFALAFATALAFGFEHPFATSFRPDSVFALIWLGLLGSGVAYLVFFRLLDHWGATRTTLVSYLMPVVGIVLGAVVLHEAIDSRILAGGALIFGGIMLVNLRRGIRPMTWRRRPDGERARAVLG